VASKYDQEGSTSIRSGVSLLKNVAGLAPLAAGAYYGFTSLKSNETIANPLHRMTPNRQLGQAIGGAARSHQRARNEAAARAVEGMRTVLSEGLAKNPELAQMISQLKQHNALIHTMSVTLESPSASLGAEAVNSLKSSLSELMSNSNPKTLKELATSVISTMLETNSDELMMEWNKNLDYSRSVASQLQVPNFGDIKSGQAFSAVDVGALQGTLRKRFDSLQSSLPEGMSATLHSAKSPGGGRDMYVAQLMSSGGAYQASVPIQLGGGRGEQRGFLFRSGESFNTLYASPARAGNMTDIHRHSMDVGAGNMTYESLKGQRAIREMPDHVIDILRKNLESGAGMKGFKDEMREAMMVVDRAAFTDTALGGHVLEQARLQSNVLYGHSFGRLATDASLDLISNLAMMSDDVLDAGAAGGKRLHSGFNADRRSIIGFSAGSGFQALQNAYGTDAINRNTLPITARESQVLGRATMGLDDFRTLGAGHVGIGSTAGRVAENMAWGSTVTGGSNKYMIVDFKYASAHHKGGALWREVQGQGLAFSAHGQTQLKSRVLSVLDPRAHGYAASQTMNEVMQAGGTRTYTAAQIHEGRYFGQAGNVPKSIGRDPHMIDTTIRYTGRGTSAGKQMLYYSEQMRRRIGFAKQFGLTFKGNVEARGKHAIDLMYVQDPRLLQAEQDLAGANIRGIRYDAVHTSSDMFKKGTGIFTHQLYSSARQHGVSNKALKTAVDRISGGGRFAAGHHGLVAEAMFGQLRSRGVSGGAIGMALAGVYYGAGGVNKTTGLRSGQLSTNQLEAMINTSTMSAGDKKNAISAMRRGLVGFVDTFQFGESIGDWGTARVGTESRFAKTSFERLRGMGMSAEGASNVVSNMYMNKVGFGRHFAMAKEMMDMGRGMTGQRNIIDAFTERGAQRLSWKQMPDALQGGTLSEYLKQQEKGVVLDFSDAPPHMRRAVQQTFGHDTLPLSGKAAFDAAPGTMIKQAGGGTLDISGQYGRLVDGLFSRLSGNKTPGSGDELRKSLKAWQREGIDLMSRTITGLSSGKLAGSSSPRVSAINLNTALGYTDPAREAMSKLFTGTRATPVMGDTTMFLSELYNQGGGFAHKAHQARKFFTGMERTGPRAEALTRASGLIRMSGRHPVMSSGNVFVTQMFRHVKEVGRLGGKDEFFGQFMAAAGDQLDNDLRTLKSFEEVAQLGKAKQRRFFNVLVRNLEKFTGGQGGGTLTVLRANAQTAAGLMDIGLAPQAFMDADGDTAISVTLSKGDSQRVRKLLQNMTPQQMGQELRYRTAMDQFGGMIKGGMTKYGTDILGISAKDPASYAMAIQRENIKKEVNIAMSTGAMDTRLRGAHEAFMEFGGGELPENLMRQRMNRSFLGALEEHVLLKAKHIERHADVAGQVGAGVENLVKNPTEITRENFRALLKEKVVRGQSGAIDIGRITTTGQDAASKNMKSFLDRATATGNLSWNVDSFVDDLFDAAVKYKDAGGTLDFTHGQHTRSALDNPQAYFVHSLAGNSMEYAALREAAGSAQPARISNAFETMKSALSKIDRRMTLPLAVGAGLSMLALGAMGSPGYAATPISVPGEATDPAVADAIARGNLFQGNDPQVTPESMQQEQGYAMMNSPINRGTTYMQRPGAYSIRGNVQHYAGLAEASNMIGQFTGGNAAGSIRINDSRRPITQNYVDRLLGEY